MDSVTLVHAFVAELLHLQKPRFTVITVAKNLQYDFGAPQNSGALGFSLLALWLIRPCADSLHLYLIGQNIYNMLLDGDI